MYYVDIVVHIELYSASILSQIGLYTILYNANGEYMGLFINNARKVAQLIFIPTQPQHNLN